MTFVARECVPKIGQRQEMKVGTTPPRRQQSIRIRFRRAGRGKAGGSGSNPHFTFSRLNAMCGCHPHRASSWLE
jgi:hypothetical protein